MSGRHGWLLVGTLFVGCGEPTPAPSCGAGEERRLDGRCQPVVVGCAPGELELGGACVRPACAAGSWLAPDGACIPAGLPSDAACAPGEGILDDACVPAGVPPDGCAEGFVHDGDRGCEPILPAAPCGPGLMAVPGDEICHPVGSCGSGTWGDLAVEPDTQFVDASFAGVSDGSAAAPWTSVQEGVDAAVPGAIVAIAAGTYVESAAVVDKAVRLWGRCAAMVEITFAPPGRFNEISCEENSAVALIRADGSEVRGLALTGYRGLCLRYSQAVVGEGLWFHDIDDIGLLLFPSAPPASMRLAHSLVENAGDTGLHGEGHLDVEAVEVRGSRGDAGIAAPGVEGVGLVELAVRRSRIADNRGAGIACNGCTGVIIGSTITGTRDRPKKEADGFGIAASSHTSDPISSSLLVEGSYLDDNQVAGIGVQGAEARVVNTVVRGTIAFDGQAGHGIQAQPVEAMNMQPFFPATVEIIGSLVTENRAQGIAIAGADARLERVVVRDTLPIPSRSAGQLGIGIAVRSIPSAAASCAIEASLIEGNTRAGILGVDAVVSVTGSRVRGTGEDGSGLGIGIAAAGSVGSLEIYGSAVEDSYGAGIAIAGVSATITSSTIALTHSATAGGGAGLLVQPGEFGSPASVSALGLAIADSWDSGVAVLGSDASLVGTLVSGSRAAPDGRFGDGVSAISSFERQATLTLEGVAIVESDRAAISSFGAHVTYRGIALSCQGFDIDGEASAFGSDFTFEDRGGNACGCPEAGDRCLVVSSALEPPELIEGIAP